MAEVIARGQITIVAQYDVMVQYSANGKNWHSGYMAGDIYMRQSTDGGMTWSDAILLKGADYTENILRNSAWLKMNETNTAPEFWSLTGNIGTGYSEFLTDEKFGECTIFHVVSVGLTSNGYGGISYYTGNDKVPQYRLENNKTYTMSFWLRCDDFSTLDGTQMLEVYRRSNGSRKKGWSIHPNLKVEAEEGVWKLYKQVFTLAEIEDDCDGFEFRFSLFKNGDVYFTAPKLEEGANYNPVWSPNSLDMKGDKGEQGDAGASYTENLLLNSAFYQAKNGVATDWFYYGGSTYSKVDDTVKLNGCNTVKVEVSGVDANKYYGLQQNTLETGMIHPQVGETYTISVWYYTDDDTTIDADAGLEVYMYRASGFVGSGSVTFNPVSGVWKQAKKTFTVTSECNRFQYRLWVRKNGRVWFACPKIERGSNPLPVWTANQRDNKGDKGDNAINYKLIPQYSVMSIAVDGKSIKPTTLTVKQYRIDGNNAAVETTDCTIKYQYVYESGATKSVATYPSAGIKPASGDIVYSGSRLKYVQLYLYKGTAVVDQTAVSVVTDAYEVNQIFEAKDGTLTSQITALQTSQEKLNNDTVGFEIEINLCGLDENTWYPVTFALRDNCVSKCWVRKKLVMDSDETKPSWATHPTATYSFIFNLEWESIGSSWGASKEDRTVISYGHDRIETFRQAAAAGRNFTIPEGMKDTDQVPPCSKPFQFTNTSMECVYLRGGTKWICGMNVPSTSNIKQRKPRIQVCRRTWDDVVLSSQTKYNPDTWKFKDSYQGKMWGRSDIWYNSTLTALSESYVTSGTPKPIPSDFTEFDDFVNRGEPGFEGYIDFAVLEASWPTTPTNVQVGNKTLKVPKPPVVDFDDLARRVTVNETSIKQNSNSITLQASQISSINSSLTGLSTDISDLSDELESKTASLQQKITDETGKLWKDAQDTAELVRDNQDSIAANTALIGSTKEELQQKISDNTTAIEQNTASIQLQQDAINQRVTRTEFDEELNPINSSISEIRQRADSIRLQVVAAKNFNIVNLLPNHETLMIDPYTTMFTANGGTQTTDQMHLPAAVLGGAGIRFNQKNDQVIMRNAIHLPAGKYTISFTVTDFDFATQGVLRPQAYMRSDAKGWITGTGSYTPEWNLPESRLVRWSWKFNIDTEDDYKMIIASWSDIPFTIYDIVWESGDVAHDYCTENDKLKASGILIEPEQITLAADKVRVRVSDSDSGTAVFSAGRNGEAVLNTALVRAESMECYDNLNNVQASVNELGDGAYKIYYPSKAIVGGGSTHKVMCNFGYDPVTDSIIQFYGEDGTVLWTIGKVFNIPSPNGWNQPYRWEHISLVPEGSVNSSQITSTANLSASATDYYKFVSDSEESSGKVDDGAIRPYKYFNGWTFLSMDLTATLIADGFYYSPTAGMKMSGSNGTSMSSPGVVQTWTRRKYRYISGKLSVVTDVEFEVVS